MIFSFKAIGFSLYIIFRILFCVIFGFNFFEINCAIPGNIWGGIILLEFLFAYLLFIAIFKKDVLHEIKEGGV